jgi:hypothetical protein
VAHLKHGVFGCCGCIYLKQGVFGCCGLIVALHKVGILLWFADSNETFVGSNCFI